MNEAVLGGLGAQSLEVVARYNYTGLNDINKGEYFSAGRNQYYPDGYMADYPYNSSSVGGGDVNSFTVGLNYSFNKYTQLMLNYTLHKVDKDFLPYDKTIHALQARVLFSF